MIGVAWILGTMGLVERYEEDAERDGQEGWRRLMQGMRRIRPLLNGGVLAGVSVSGGVWAILLG